jgi:hypothetical protein
VYTLVQRTRSNFLSQQYYLYFKWSGVGVVIGGLSLCCAAMLRSCRRPALCYDLPALASASTVTVGRAGDSTIRLDSPEVPFLLSRKHAELTILPDGQVVLRDNHSTNGTYVARRGGILDKLAHGCAWILQHGDTIGFGELSARQWLWICITIRYALPSVLAARCSRAKHSVCMQVVQRPSWPAAMLQSAIPSSSSTTQWTLQRTYNAI